MTADLREGLEACPFCSIGQRFFSTQYNPRRYRLECGGCGCTTAWFDSEEETRAAWNRRSPALLALARDGERMDWLEAAFAEGSISATRYGPGTAGCELFTVHSQHVRGYLLRGAIDAAIAALSQPGAEA